MYVHTVICTYVECTMMEYQILYITVYCYTYLRTYNNNVCTYICTYVYVEHATTEYQIFNIRMYIPVHYSPYRIHYDGIPAFTADGKKVLLFMGIIDILQSYRLKKKLEHTFKAIYADGVSEICTYGC